MSGLELATAYVSLSVSAKGLAKGVRSEFRQVEREADTSGRAAGEAISRGVKRGTSGVGDAIGDEVAKGGANAETEGRKAGERFGAKMSEGLKATAKAAGGAAVLVGGVFTKSLSDALDARQGTAKLTAQLGLTERQSATAGRAAGKLFSGNYGDAVDISGALKSVMQNIDGMKGASEKSLTSVSAKVLTVSKAFDQDLGGTTRAVSQMMRTGLAKNADEALDIITVGFQKGADKSEDFLDTLNEYGTQFRKVGIDGRTATGLIQQGLQAGARDGDLVADSIKEFSIRAIDGSKNTVAAYKDLGLNADAMTKKIAAGGPAAKQGLGEVLTRLRGIKDPAKQAEIAVSLFGTQAEDMGKALFALDPSKAAKGLGDVAGATDKANKAMNSTPQAKLQNFIRSIQGGLVEAISTKAIPAMEQFKAEFDKGEGAVGQFRDALEKVKSAIEAVVNFVKAHPDLTKGLIGGLAGLYAAKKAVDGVSSAFRGVKSGVDTAKAGWDAGKTAISGLKTAASSTSTALSGLKAGLSGAKPPNATAWTAAGNSIRNAGAAAKGYAASAMSASRAALASAASSARAGAAAALAAAKQGILTAATKVMTVAQRALNLVMRMNPIGIVITALVALGAALVLAYKKSETFRNIVNAVWRVVKSSIKGTVDWFRNTAWPTLRNVLTWIGDKMNAAKVVIQRAWDAIKDKFQSVVNWVKGAFKRSWDGIKTVLSKPVEWGKQLIDRQITGMRRIFTAIRDFMKGAFKRSWDGLKKIFTAPIELAKSSISGILGKDDKSGLRGVFNNALEAVKKIWEKLKGIVAKPINGVIRIINNPFIKGFNKIGGMVGLKIDAGGKDGGIPEIKGYASGGTIPGPWKGPRADNVLGVSNSGIPVARVNPGEYITKVSSTERMNRNFPGALDYINRTGSLPGFAGGGGIPKSGQSWQWQWEQVRKQFPDARLTSAYRPGARTRGYGNTSYHAIGRAIDIGGSPSTLAAIARWIQSNWLGQTHDLLYTPLWGSQGFYKGRWSTQVANTVADHRNHVHWGLEGNAEKGKSLWGQIKGAVSGFVFDKLKGPAFKLIDGAVSKFGGGDFTKKFLGGLAKKLIEKAISFGNDSGGGDGSADAAPSNVSGAVALGKQMAAARGWTGGEWDALYQLWQRESGWRVNADNPISDAYGIPQALPGSKMAAAGSDWRTNAATQIKWGMDYIAGRPDYGTPSRAWAKWQSRIPHWYADGGLVEAFSKAPVFDNGGTLAPGINVVNNKTGGPEPLVRPERYEGRGVSVTINGVKHDTSAELAREVTWEMRRLETAGKYRGA